MSKNPYAGGRVTPNMPAGRGARPAPAGGSPPMSPQTAGQYRPGRGMAQPSLGDNSAMVRGTAGRPDLEPLDDDAVDQPGSDRGSK